MGSTSTNSVCPSVFTNVFATSLAGPRAKHKIKAHTNLTLESVAWDFSTLWTSLNYLQVLDQDKINASHQLYKSQDISQPKVILPWLPFWEIPVTCCYVPLLSLLTSFSSSPMLTSAHHCTSGFQQTAFPSRWPWRMQKECRRNKTYLLYLVLSGANSHFLPVSWCLQLLFIVRHRCC